MPANLSVKMVISDAPIADTNGVSKENVEVYSCVIFESLRRLSEKLNTSVKQIINK